MICPPVPMGHPPRSRDRRQHRAVNTRDADLAEWGQGFRDSGALTGVEKAFQAAAGA